MMIKNLFEKDIARSINGVVKADQTDNTSAWQELDEYVVTKELVRHFRGFFDTYLKGIEGRDADAAGQIGVWVSGFFGSGKSHFIKILSYLLANREVSSGGETRRAVGFFDSKIKDAMLLGDIKRAVGSGGNGETDVILFNIDSKANPSDGRGAILKVFLKVFNEMLGYSGDHPHIAALERHLEAQGKLDEFHRAFGEIAGGSWKDERDAYQFKHDEIVLALSRVLAQSEDASRQWLDSAEERFPLSPENFAKWVAEYLDRKSAEQGAQQRILFLVDEIGQFIGNDTHLMLSLQTITETLGTVCKGRAWVLVTSQENLDAVLGDKVGNKANDFSKIQGRFRTRLSLSSSNTNEVIQHRLLEKTPAARAELETFYAANGDLLNNQFSFTNVSMTLQKFDGVESFTANYPFVPYQYQLMQSVFEEIRKHGASGRHLSRGERSMLEAFKIAAQAVGEQEIGALVPLYRFYPSVESFLDTSVSRTISQAAERGLSAFETDILRTLFLIRYVQEFKSNIDNLITLCVDHVDCDRLALRRKIEASLQRLESETLVGRNGDDFFFLTNEERDISREIKNVELHAGDDIRLLAEIVFKDALKDNSKHRFQENKKDFSFNRDCDGIPFGSQFAAHELVVSIVSPLGDEYAALSESRCVLESSKDGGKVLLKLGQDDALARELVLWLRTDRYIKTTSDPTLPETRRRVLADRQNENTQRRQRLQALVEKLLMEADYFVAGQTRAATGATAASVLAEQLDYLIKNSFTKLNYLKALKENPLGEIQAVLRANDVGQQSLEIDAAHANAAAIQDVLEFIALSGKQNRAVVLGELIDRYAKRPFGWPDWETVLIVARLQVLGEISVVADGATVAPQKSYEQLSKAARRGQITLQKRKTVGSADLQQARKNGQDAFAKIGPEAEDALVAFLRAQLGEWQSTLKTFAAVEETGQFPGGEEIKHCAQVLQTLLAPQDSFGFIENFNAHQDDLLNVRDDFLDLQSFYGTQRVIWDRLTDSLAEFKSNASELEKDAVAVSALRDLREIATSARPYGRIKDVDALLAKMRAINDALVQTRRAETAAQLATAVAQVESELDTLNMTGTERGAFLVELRDLETRAAREGTIGNLLLAMQETNRVKDAALDAIAAAAKAALEKQNAAASTRSDAEDAETPAAVAPKIRPRVVVKPHELMSKSYLENDDDVAAFLEALRAKLQDAIANDARIEIR